MRLNFWRLSYPHSRSMQVSLHSHIRDFSLFPFFIAGLVISDAETPTRQINMRLCALFATAITLQHVHRVYTFPPASPADEFTSVCDWSLKWRLRNWWLFSVLQNRKLAGMTETRKNSPILLGAYTKWDAVTCHDNYALAIKGQTLFELKDRKTITRSAFYGLSMLP